MSWYRTGTVMVTTGSKPKKLNELMQGLAEIRRALPYAKDGE